MVQKCRDIANAYREDRNADKVLAAIKELAQDEEDYEKLRCLVRWFAQSQKRIDESVDRESIRNIRR